MKRYLAASTVGILLLVLTGCAPTIIAPRETATALSVSKAFSVTITTITTQPYPLGMGGWVITQADRASGFVAAEMTYRSCSFLPFTRYSEFRCHTHTARVSVTLIGRPDGTTTVGIGATADREAQELAERIAARLGVFAAPTQL